MSFYLLRQANIFAFSGTLPYRSQLGFDISLDKFWNDWYNTHVFWNERYKIARPKAFDRQKALAQALHLFWRKGYAATSIEDLVDTLHLSRSSLYDTFGDKRTLFLEALTLYNKSVLTNIRNILQEAPAPLAGLQKIFDNLTVGTTPDRDAMGCFMVNSIAELTPYDATVTEIATTYSENFQQLLVEALARAAAQGEVSKDQTPEAMAAYIFNTLQGLRIVMKAGATPAQVRAIREITLNSLR